MRLSLHSISPRRIAIGILLSGFLSSTLETRAATHWPQFRGPNGQGVSEEARPPEKLDADSNREWVVDAPEAYSSVVVWNDRIFTTGLKEDLVNVTAIHRKDGARLWNKIIEPKIEFVDYRPENGHRVASTPAVDSDVLVVYSYHVGLIAFDHDGNLKWKKELARPKTMYCPATSPLLHAGRVYLCLDGGDMQAGAGQSPSLSKLYAFNATDGSLVWETPRPFGTIGNSTPVIWDRQVKGAAVKELVVLGGMRLAGYDLASGEMNWWVGGFAHSANITPVMGGGIVFACATSMLGISTTAYEGPPWEKFLEFDKDKDGTVELGDLPDGFVFESRPELPKETPGYGTFPFKMVAQGMDQNNDGKFSKPEFENMIKEIQSYGEPALKAVRPEGRGDVTGAAVVWQAARSIPESPSPIYYRGRLYSVKDGGIVVCYDSESGKALYTERLGAGGLYTASPVAAQGRVYFCSTSGVVTVIEAGDAFMKVSQNDIHEPIYATPALVGSHLYLRTLNRLHDFVSR